jgi:hypothetical protein
LGQKKFIVGFEIVIGIFGKRILKVIGSWNVCWYFWLNLIRGVVLVQDVEQLLQPGEELSWIFAWPVSQIGEAIHNHLTKWQIHF